MRDFNSALFGYEGALGGVGLHDLLEMVHQLGLIDLGFKGLHFT